MTRTDRRAGGGARPPDRVAVEVDSGAARITLPDAAYRVSHDVSAGG